MFRDTECSPREWLQLSKRLSNAALPSWRGHGCLDPYNVRS